MRTPQTAPYGSWKSPIHAAQIAEGTLRLSQIEISGAAVYWKELRPGEGGRCVVVRRFPDGSTADVVPVPFNVRTRVHEYGGGGYLVDGDTVYFSNFADQRLYRVTGAGPPEPVTPEAEMRYADGIGDPRRGRLILVREDHTTGAGEPVNTLVALDPEAGGSGDILVSGKDFYASPRLSPDGSHLAWLTWNHPEMPWDAAELWVAPVDAAGNVQAAVHVAGGPDESVVQPEWSPNGVLHFISDRTNWWNLYRRQDGQAQPLAPMAADFARPQWGFRMSSYAFASAGRIVCTYCRNGTWVPAVLDTESGSLDTLDTSFRDISDVRADQGHACFVGGSPTSPTAVIRLDLQSARVEVLQRAGDFAVEADYLSVPEPIEYPTEGGQTAHGFFYAPRNPDFSPPSGEKPPLVVMSHGGPTSATSLSLRLGIQYYTSRGVAVLDVNYGGSSGYGRAYRRRLRGRWGVVDVDDCVNGARWLVERGEADGSRLAITGGSAGGYTTISALTFRDIFAAGASHFGISDCEALALETHKFESRYLDSLIGPYPEQRDLYRRRSPIHHADRLACPVIFFQGLEDRVVPPNQAEKMVAVLRAKGLPVAYVTFEGEQHGFRQAENIRRAVEAELYFFSRIFGFELADAVEPVEIENL